MTDAVLIKVTNRELRVGFCEAVRDGWQTILPAALVGEANLPVERDLLCVVVERR